MLFVLDVRIDLHVIYIDRVYSYQLNFAQYSVPVYLGKFGVGMVPFMGIVLVAVVYTESYQFFFCLDVAIGSVRGCGGILM